MKRRIGILWLMILLGGVQGAMAQEVPLRFEERWHDRLHQPLQLDIPPMSLWSGEAALRWQQLERQKRYAREDHRNSVSRASLEPLKSKVARDRKQWQVRVRIAAGNTAIQNWSPYPDRALDARVIRYPMRQPDFGKPRK